MENNHQRETLKSIFISVILAKKFYKNNPALRWESMAALCSTACVPTLYDPQALGTGTDSERTDALFANAPALVLQLTSPLNRLPAE